MFAHMCSCRSQSLGFATRDLHRSIWFGPELFLHQSALFFSSLHSNAPDTLGGFGGCIPLPTVRVEPRCFVFGISSCGMPSSSWRSACSWGVIVGCPEYVGFFSTLVFMIPHCYGAGTLGRGLLRSRSGRSRCPDKMCLLESGSRCCMYLISACLVGFLLIHLLSDAWRSYGDGHYRGTSSIERPLRIDRFGPTVGTGRVGGGSR